MQFNIHHIWHKTWNQISKLKHFFVTYSIMAITVLPTSCKRNDSFFKVIFVHYVNYLKMTKTIVQYQILMEYQCLLNVYPLSRHRNEVNALINVSGIDQFSLPQKYPN